MDTIYVVYLIPLLIMVVGFFMFKYPPKKINWFVGYRTRKSMQNEKVWKESNKYCGKVWIKLGIVMLLLSFILILVLHLYNVILTETILAVIVLSQVAVLVIFCGIIEKNIRKKFK